MKELLKEQLDEYQTKLDENEAECIRLMKAREPWHELAKKGAGIKMILDHVKDELKKYN